MMRLAEIEAQIGGMSELRDIVGGMSELRDIVGAMRSLAAMRVLWRSVRNRALKPSRVYRQVPIDDERLLPAVHPTR